MSLKKDLHGVSLLNLVTNVVLEEAELLSVHFDINLLSFCKGTLLYNIYNCHCRHV